MSGEQGRSNETAGSRAEEAAGEAYGEAGEGEASKVWPHLCKECKIHHTGHFCYQPDVEICIMMVVTT